MDHSQSVAICCLMLLNALPRDYSRIRTGLAFLATGAVQFAAGLGGLALATVAGWIGGPALLGSLTVLISILGVLGMVSRRGQGSLLTRSVAWAVYAQGYDEALTLLFLALRRVVVLSMILGGIGSVGLFSGIFGNPFPGSVVAFPILLLLTTILALFAGFSRGVGRPWLAPFFEMGGVSLVTVTLLVAALAVCDDLSASVVTGALLLAMVCLIAIASVSALRYYGGGSVFRPSCEQRRELEVGQVPFTLIAISSYLIQSGSFLIAAPILTAVDLGLLRAAERLALMVSFPVLAVLPVTAPLVVRHVRNGEKAKLTKLMAASMTVCGGIASIVLLFLIIFPEQALALMGDEFKSAAPFLKVMGVTHLVAATLGPLVGLLHTSGNERVSMWITLGVLALAFALVPLLSMTYGAYGFAVAYAIINTTRLALIAGYIVWNRVNALSAVGAIGDPGQR